MTWARGFLGEGATMTRKRLQTIREVQGWGSVILYIVDELIKTKVKITCWDVA